MPKQTFFNLSSSKQDILMKAAMDEFARVPLHEASIANIINEADIARGSFYQYFEDKEDLYFYLLQLDTENRRQTFVAQIQENNGDFFAALIDHLKLIIFNDFKAKKDREFYRHVFLNMNYKTETTFKMNKIDEMDEEVHQYIKQISELIDITHLRLSNEKDLTQMIHITSTMLLQNIIGKFARDLSDEEVIENFTHQLELLKKGFLAP